jgi:hypothetical protein
LNWSSSALLKPKNDSFHCLDHALDRLISALQRIRRRISKAAEAQAQAVETIVKRTVRVKRQQEEEGDTSAVYLLCRLPSEWN